VGGAASHVAEFSKFFEMFRQHDAAPNADLLRFFERFERDYRHARVVRMPTTPHLNVLRVFGLEFRELRHSDALAWFLNPEAEHEQGALFANTLLHLLAEAPLEDERYCVERERHGRTDVTFYSPARFVVFIENKVRHIESDDQVKKIVLRLAKLSRDQAIPLERRFAVFLTDTGASPVTGPTSDSPDFLISRICLRLLASNFSRASARPCKRTSSLALC
jgi:hypothetical protein